MGLAVVAIICWFDYATGPDISFSIFYLMPIVATGWWFGSRIAVLTAAAATVAWITADIAAYDHSISISGWNGFTRAVIFISMGFLTARIRLDQQRLSALAARLEEERAREAELARRDSLTGLPNSRAFMEVLADRIRACRSSGRSICVLYVDVDNFKRVNDSLGHAAGDEALRRVAAALRDTVRADDAVGRLGGDEFAVLAADVPAELPERIARRLLERIELVARDFPDTGLGASVGVAFLAAPPEDPEEVLRRADSAMYEAKASGKNRIAFWTDRATRG